MRALVFLALVAGCSPAKEPRTVAFRVLARPLNASVTIDDRTYPLATVALGAVRLTPGEHHVSVEAPGYLPWDKIVVASESPVTVKVDLVPIPD
jgi:hypothetical protein